MIYDVSNESQTGIRTHDWYRTLITMIKAIPRAEIKAAQDVAT